VPKGRTAARILAALTLAAGWIVVTAGIAFADVQATPYYSDTPDTSKCSLTAPSTACGQWTYWMSIGAIVVGLIIVAVGVVSYLRFAPRFSAQEVPAATSSRPAGGGAVATIARPPVTAARPAPAAPAAAGAPPPSAEAPAAGPSTAEAPTAEAPPAEAPPAGQAEAPAATRPPSPRPEHVDPDQETFDRVLAEQLAKGTDRRVAEGRAKSAALKAAREKAAG